MQLCMQCRSRDDVHWVHIQNKCFQPDWDKIMRVEFRYQINCFQPDWDKIMRVEFRYQINCFQPDWDKIMHVEFRYQLELRNSTATNSMVR